MKRFLAAGLLAAFILVGLASVADAAGYRYRSLGSMSKRRTDLYATLVALDSHSILDQNSAQTSTAGHIDSTAFYAPNVAFTTDTTANFQLPPDFVIPAAADSMPCLILIFRNSGTQASGDTLYASLQPRIGGSTYITHAAAPIAGAKALTGVVNAGVWACFPAASGLGYAGSETMTSLLPRNVEFVPGLGPGGSFRVILWGDKSSAMTGNGLLSIDVFCTVAASTELN